MKRSDIAKYDKIQTLPQSAEFDMLKEVEDGTQVLAVDENGDLHVLGKNVLLFHWKPDQGDDNGE